MKSMWAEPAEVQLRWECIGSALGVLWECFGSAFRVLWECLNLKIPFLWGTSASQRLLHWHCLLLLAGLASGRVETIKNQFVFLTGLVSKNDFVRLREGKSWILISLWSCFALPKHSQSAQSRFLFEKLKLCISCSVSPILCYTMRSEPIVKTSFQ